MPAARYAIQSLLQAHYRRDFDRLDRLVDLEAAQRDRLVALCRQNATSDFGTRHGFSEIRTVADYQTAVPLGDYESHAPYIARIEAGEAGVLTTAPVRLLEPTSGSTSAKKWIPYTAALQREFQSGIRPWLYDLYTRYPQLRKGRSYWSITPATAETRRSSGGIPIGFDDDAAYLGKLEGALTGLLMAVPSDLARERDRDAFYRKTAIGLLRCRDLALVSVWSPTFFALLLDCIESVRADLLPSIPFAERDRMEGAIRSGDWAVVWPHLQLVSAWADASSAAPAKALAERLPQAAFQPKGLIATECFVSLPIGTEDGARLSAASHFFEFTPMDGGAIRLAHELEIGHEYGVVVTTGGGLYRYQMGDVVRVTGFSGVLPRLRFCGRSGVASDLYGEKLDERFVDRILERACPDARFRMLAPDGDRYVLYADRPPIADPDALLRESFHYDHCRKLGQLKPLCVAIVAPSAGREWIEHLARDGRRMGDVKPPALSTKDGWDHVLTLLPSDDQVGTES